MRFWTAKLKSEQAWDRDLPVWFFSLVKKSELVDWSDTHCTTQQRCATEHCSQWHRHSPIHLHHSTRQSHTEQQQQ